MSSTSRKASITSYLYSSIYKNRRQPSSLHNQQQTPLGNNLNPHYPAYHYLNKKISLTRSIMDCNQINFLMNNLNQNNLNNGKEASNQNIDSESRDFVTVGSNEDIYLPTLNNPKRIAQQSFQVLSEEDDENISTRIT